MFTGALSYAQQDAQFTQYMYNTVNVNPAYAGSRGALSIFGLHRTQWVGVDGAPTTNAVSVNSPIGDSKLGVGLSFVNDKIGFTADNAISADVSYTVQTSETFKLSFGIKGTGNFFNIDAQKAEFADPESIDRINDFTPNVGAGVYFHSDKAYVGLSVPNFITNKQKYDDTNKVLYQEKMSYYLIAGYVFDLSPNTKFKPALMTKATAGAPLQADISGNFMFMEKFVLGAAYRWDAAVSGMAGFQITDGLFIGYGYDYDTTNLNNYSKGSHEVFLRFELLNNFNKIISPRFF